MTLNYLFVKIVLHSKTLSTATTTAGIGIVEIKTFAIQSIAKFQLGIY